MSLHLRGFNNSGFVVVAPLVRSHTENHQDCDRVHCFYFFYLQNSNNTSVTAGTNICAASPRILQQHTLLHVPAMSRLSTTPLIEPAAVLAEIKLRLASSAANKSVIELAKL